MYRSLVYFLALIIATVLGQNIIIQGPKDVVLPISAQARFTCVANSSLNVTRIGWLAITTAINGNPLTITSNEQLSSVGINLVPSGSKFISEISVEGVAKNNGTLLFCRVTLNGSVVPNAQSTKAKLILYGPPDPVSIFTYAVAGIHSFNFSWSPIGSSFPFNYTIDIVSAASSESIMLDRTATDYVYKVDNPSLSCEKYNFTVRGVNEAGFSGESEVLTLTLPDVESTQPRGSIDYAIRIPVVCSDYPVTSYTVTLRENNSSMNFSLLIPATSTNLHDSHVTLTLRDPQIVRNKVYLLSIVAENDVGPSKFSQEIRISTISSVVETTIIHTTLVTTGMTRVIKTTTQSTFSFCSTTSSVSSSSSTSTIVMNTSTTTVVPSVSMTSTACLAGTSSPSINSRVNSNIPAIAGGVSAAGALLLIIAIVVSIVLVITLSKKRVKPKEPTTTPVDTPTNTVQSPTASVSVGIKENVAYGSAAGSIHKAVQTSDNIAYSQVNISTIQTAATAAVYETLH